MENAYSDVGGERSGHHGGISQIYDPPGISLFTSLCEKFLYAFAAVAIQGEGIWWGESHTQHHTFTDAEGDPHRPDEYGGGLLGFLWAHMGWLFFEVKPAPPDYRKPTRFIESPGLNWQKKYYWPLALCGFFVPCAITGWDGVLLAGFFRLAVCWHLTWSVNSFCHVMGSHATDTSDEIFETHGARNFPLWCFFTILALFSGGEFWHANHHARQRSAYLGWRWFELDPGGLVIKLLEKIGFIWDVETSGVIEQIQKI